MKQRDFTPVHADSVDEVVNDFYGWRWNEDSHQKLFVPVGCVSAVSLAVAALAL